MLHTGTSPKLRSLFRSLSKYGLRQDLNPDPTESRACVSSMLWFLPVRSLWFSKTKVKQIIIKWGRIHSFIHLYFNLTSISFIHSAYFLSTYCVPGKGGESCADPPQQWQGATVWFEAPCWQRLKIVFACWLPLASWKTPGTQCPAELGFSSLKMEIDTPVQWLVSQRQEITHFSEDMETRELMCTVGENANWCCHCGKLDFSQNTNKPKIPYDPVIPLLGS